MSVLPCILSHKFCSFPRNPIFIENKLDPLSLNTVGNIFYVFALTFCGLRISPRPKSVSGIVKFQQLILISLTFLLLQMVMSRFFQIVLRGGGILLVGRNGNIPCTLTKKE